MPKTFTPFFLRRSQKFQYVCGKFGEIKIKFIASILPKTQFFCKSGFWACPLQRSGRAATGSVFTSFLLATLSQAGTPSAFLTHSWHNEEHGLHLASQQVATEFLFARTARILSQAAGLLTSLPKTIKTRSRLYAGKLLNSSLTQLTQNLNGAYFLSKRFFLLENQFQCRYNHIAIFHFVTMSQLEEICFHFCCR